MDKEEILANLNEVINEHREETKITTNLYISQNIHKKISSIEYVIKLIEEMMIQD